MIKWHMEMVDCSRGWGYFLGTKEADEAEQQLLLPVLPLTF